ncbi:MAG: twin-arginine translocase TatA/TatE family subunit [Dehalococcoidia bacterium]|nr:MAG: twin-arginine translocase TatA/TatE family subunit [Dehalococcoidia bacterium]
MVFPHIGGWELILILVVILIVFGVGKLPQAGEALGKGLRAFRKGQSGEAEAEEEEAPAKPKRKTAKKKAKKTKTEAS